MSVLLIKSTNENFSHVISKNPESGMIAKTLRRGTSFGWFGDLQTYLIYFKDSYNEVSYNKNDTESFEYNDLSRYNSPVFILNVLSEYLSSTFKKVHEYDVEGYVNEVEMNIEVSRLNLIKNMFYRTPDIEINYDDLGGNNYKVKVSTKKSLNYLLNFVNVYCLFVAIIDEYWMNMTDEMLKKYVKALNEIKATYYMRYLFKLKVIVSKKLFESVKEELEDLDGYNLELLYGNTQDWRREFVFKNLGFDKSVIDIGCGEGSYSLPLAKKIPDEIIHAIDIDEECTRTVERKAESRGYSNIQTYGSLEDYKNLNPDEENRVDILMVEVIEHMEKEKAKSLLKDALKLNFNKLFVTSPCAEFNVHYDLENSIEEDGRAKNGFRHHDHKWEGTVSEFTEMVLECLKEELTEKNRIHKYEHFMIGDLVDGIAPTQGIVITAD